MPMWSHGPVPLWHSLCGGAEWGMISPSSHPTHGSMWNCKEGDKALQSPKNHLQAQAGTHMLTWFQFRMETNPQDTPNPAGFLGWGPTIPVPLLSAAPRQHQSQ